MNVDFLSIILSNTNQLDSETLCNCAQVSKEHNALVNTLWCNVNYRLPSDFNRLTNDGTCRFCPRWANTPFALCRRCMKKTNEIITATDTKRHWYLDEKDLKSLTVFKTYHVVYKKPIRLFYLPEVTKYALKKYTPKVLYSKKFKPTLSLSRRKRLKKLKDHTIFYDIDTPEYQLCLAAYINNGKGGIREVKTRLQRYAEFQDVLLSLQDVPFLPSQEQLNAIQEEYVLGTFCCGDVFVYIKNKALENEAQHERKEQLQKALHEARLTGYADLDMCQEFIAGEIESVEDVVEMIEEQIQLDYWNEQDYSDYLDAMAELEESA